ncbi:hypothetical protein EVAR_60185_1 [Eumeta japonica]|uniref:Uncharacterized protein n=1 Tax=Eumeta variegata TaxID=151549 RepID=A0A4C1Z1J1_EUMVA|nr:hypothetical protein EVAR_60185_1 [Eumeta japonica]
MVDLSGAPAHAGSQGRPPDTHPGHIHLPSGARRRRPRRAADTAPAALATAKADLRNVAPPPPPSTGPPHRYTTSRFASTLVSRSQTRLDSFSATLLRKHYCNIIVVGFDKVVLYHMRLRAVTCTTLIYKYIKYVTSIINVVS